MTSTVSTLPLPCTAASGMKATESESLAVLELDDAAAVALGVLEGLADLRLGGGVAGAQHALAAAQRARRRPVRAGPGRLACRMRPVRSSSSRPRSISSSTRASMPGCSASGGEAVTVAAEALQVGDLEICCGFPWVLSSSGG